MKIKEKEFYTLSKKKEGISVEKNQDTLLH